MILCLYTNDIFYAFFIYNIQKNDFFSVLDGHTLLEIVLPKHHVFAFLFRQRMQTDLGNI